MWRYGIGILFGCILCAPCANADPVGISPLPVIPGGGDGLSLGGPGGISVPNLAPGNAALFMCPGIGGSANVLGFGGGYCDFNFQPVRLSETTYGVMHSHCEWGGASPIFNAWNCWRVFPGQPDHPALPDPDVIPDGMGVPWAIQGPVPSDQWPPPGLAPGQDLLNNPIGMPPGPAPEVPTFAAPPP